MKLKQYLLEERSKAIGVHEAHEIVEKHCKKSLDLYRRNHGSIIYRGIKTGALAMTIDPKSHERKSVGIPNYYTLIMDNAKQWSRFPKRSRSIVGVTGDMGYASSFGKVYIVFPYDGSVIAMAPTRDLWSLDYGSFARGLARYVHGNADRDWNTFKKALEDIEDRLKSVNYDYFKISENMLNFFYRFDLSRWWKKYDSLLDAIVEEVINPREFTIKKAGQALNSRKEVWTDGKCVLILQGVLPEDYL